MNVDLAKKVYHHISAHPDQFEMDTFADVSPASECGTTACIAGWAMVLSGEFTLDVEGRGRDRLAVFNRVSEEAGSPYDGDLHNAGRRLLGLTEYQANLLFYTDANDRAVERLHDMIADAEAGVSDGR